MAPKKEKAPPPSLKPAKSGSGKQKKLLDDDVLWELEQIEKEAVLDEILNYSSVAESEIEWPFIFFMAASSWLNLIWDMGCHIDEFIAVVAHTHVLQDGKVTRKAADVIAAANTAAEVALRLVRPGKKFTGATQSLHARALLVNPWNITEVASSVGQALNMSADEKE